MCCVLGTIAWDFIGLYRLKEQSMHASRSKIPLVGESTGLEVQKSGVDECFKRQFTLSDLV